MKVKTSELTRAALDWAVAKCEGRGKSYTDYFASQWHLNKSLRYSTEWARGGPIMEREKIATSHGSALDPEFEFWHAVSYDDMRYQDPFTMKGPTLLIAAMRCYVASKLGDEVDVPEELGTPTKI